MHRFTAYAVVIAATLLATAFFRYWPDPSLLLNAIPSSHVAAANATGSAS